MNKRYPSQKTRKLTTAAAIVEFLKNQYTSRDGQEHRLIQGVFGIFGHGNVSGLGQALEEFGGTSLSFYQPKNEQSMVHTASAFAKAKKRMSTFACTTSVGPGATNMITGAAAATINRLPVLLLPGDIFANRIPNPVLQQLEHPSSMDISVNNCFKEVSKYWDRIQRPEQILLALPEAMRILADLSQTGAVTICLPEDVQTEAYEYPVNFFEKRVYEQDRPTTTPEKIKHAVGLLRKAQKPLIVAGGGVHYSDATRILNQFSETTGIPVAMTQAGLGAMVDPSSQNLGSIGVTGNLAANEVAKEADVIIVVGTRLSDFTTASKTQFQNPETHFISVNTNSFDAYKHGAFPLVGDAQAILNQLQKALEGYKIPSTYQQKLNRLQSDWDQAYLEITKTQNTLSQAEVIRTVNEFIDSDSTIVHAAGGLPGDLHKLWKPKSHSSYHSEYGYSCMGYEIAGALGVKFASPKNEVYAFVGDGSYLMLNHELLTSIQENKKITVLLIDNHGYQCIHNLQKGCGGQSFGNEFRSRESESKRLSGEVLSVDYCKNAESLGVTTFKASTSDEIRQALLKAKSELKSCLIYISIPAGQNIPGYSWWDVPVAEESHLESVQEARKKYETQTKNQRFYY